MDRKTIEQLCFSGTQGDLWYELNRDENISSSIMHSFPPASTFSLRFLGPFIKATRIYTGSLSKAVASIDLGAIINGNKDAYNVASKIIIHKYQESGVGKVGEALARLDNIFGNKKNWQKCILVNALCEDLNKKIAYPTLNIVSLSTTICDKIGALSSRREKSKCIISGLNAYSIKLTKRGIGLKSEYDVFFMPKSDLPLQLVNKIIFDGLYDIPSSIKKINKKRYPYIYRLEPNYRMSTELMSCIMDEYKRLEEGKQIDRAEEVGIVSDDMFERLNNLKNGIGSLEV